MQRGRQDGTTTPFECHVQLVCLPPAWLAGAVYATIFKNRLDGYDDVLLFKAAL